MKAQTEKSADSENRTVTGQWNHCPVGRPAKTHQDFWRSRVKRRPFRDDSGKLVTPPEFSVRMFHLGREAWFNLDTANQAAAALKARDIYLSLAASGWDVTLAKYKPGMGRKPECCTLGEFLQDVETLSHLKPVTIRRYAVKLRKLISDVAELEKGLSAKERRAKYDYVNGGRNAWLKKVDAQRIDVLTPERIAVWRNSYVAKAGTDPVRRKSAERSAASFLRGARSLFTAEILAVLKVTLPPNPFAGVKLKDPGAQRYHSDVNPEWLLMCADRELREAHPQQYLALFLCLWAGLRRKEADLLTWQQVDLKHGQIKIRRSGSPTLRRTLKRSKRR